MKKLTKYTLFLILIMTVSIMFSGKVYAKACSEYSYSDCPTKDSACVKDSELKKCTSCEEINTNHPYPIDVPWNIVGRIQWDVNMRNAAKIRKNLCNTNNKCMWQNSNVVTFDIGNCRTRPTKTSSDIDIIINKKTNFKCSDVKHLTSIWMFLRIVSPFLVVLFGSLDFIKAVIASDEKKIKESRGKFVKRLIAFVLLILLPFMIQFIFERIGTNGSQNMCLVKCITTNNTSSKGCD